MKIGILEAGVPPRGLIPEFGRYDAMTARLLGEGFETVSYRIQDGEWPTGPGECAGYVVTGSAAGVYDDLPWTGPLRAFLKAARGQAKLVGICFGHQIMAEAFGGRVVKSEKGWGLGLQLYEVQARPPWTDEARAISIPASHQDQVVAAPPGARVLAGSAFAPLGALVYDDGPAISFQGHPEYTSGFAKALLASRHAATLAPEDFERLSASLDGPNDCARVGEWIGRFLAA